MSADVQLVYVNDDWVEFRSEGEAVFSGHSLHTGNILQWVFDNHEEGMAFEMLSVNQCEFCGLEDEEGGVINPNDSGTFVCEDCAGDDDA